MSGQYNLRILFIILLAQEKLQNRINNFGMKACVNLIKKQHSMLIIKSPIYHKRMIYEF